MSQSLFSEILEAPRLPMGNPGNGAESGQSFMVFYNNGRYKLRMCASEEKAAEIAGLVARVEAAFPGEITPKILEQKGKYILSEYVEGADMERHEPCERLEKIGELIAKVHSVPYSAGGAFDLRFLSRLGRLVQTGQIDQAHCDRIGDEYRALNPNDKKSGIVYGDLVHHNVRCSTEGRILLEDEQGFTADLIGSRIPKAIHKWFARYPTECSQQRDAFFRGYAKVADPSFFLNNEKFFTIYFAVNWMFNRLQEGKEVEKATGLLLRACP